MKVEISAEAEHDLEQISDYIARNSSVRAASFLRELRARCLELATLAAAFPLAPRYARLGVRKRPYGAYLIFYRTEPECVVVLHILHSAMDHDAIFYPDEEGGV